MGFKLEDSTWIRVTEFLKKRNFRNRMKAEGFTRFTVSGIASMMSASNPVFFGTLQLGTYFIAKYSSVGLGMEKGLPNSETESKLP